MESVTFDGGVEAILRLLPYYDEMTTHEWYYLYCQACAHGSSYVYPLDTFCKKILLLEQCGLIERTKAYHRGSGKLQVTFSSTYNPLVSDDTGEGSLPPLLVGAA